MPSDLIRIGIILILSFIIFLLFYAFGKRIFKKDINNLTIENNIRSKILNLLLDENKFRSISAPSFDLYREIHGGRIYNELWENIDKFGNEYIGYENNIKIDKKKISDIIYSELESGPVLQKLTDYYYSMIKENIKQAELSEKEAIIYHKSFGQEPNGDPELHPRDNSEDYTNEDSYKSITDLETTGTIEEIEEENE